MDSNLGPSARPNRLTKLAATTLGKCLLHNVQTGPTCCEAGEQVSPFCIGPTVPGCYLSAIVRQALGDGDEPDD